MGVKLLGMIRIPEHGYCFGCGKASKKGLNATLYYDPETRSVRAEYIYTIHHQGPPGYAHGGATFTLLDEVMGVTAWVNGYSVMLRHMDIDYMRPVPLGKRIFFEGKIDEVVDDRKIFIRGRIYDEEGDFIVARGLYVHVEHDLFRQYRRLLMSAMKKQEGSSE